jgi:hypothetical protein
MRPGRLHLARRRHRASDRPLLRRKRCRHQLLALGGAGPSPPPPSPPPPSPPPPSHTHRTPAGLRAPEEQRWLAELAALPQVHLLASADHVNAPLLWDKHAAARCRWVWHEAATYAPYTAETLDTPYLLSGGRRGGGGAGACARCLC